MLHQFSINTAFNEKFCNFGIKDKTTCRFSEKAFIKTPEVTTSVPEFPVINGM
jgi:hypothetical protein